MGELQGVGNLLDIGDDSCDGEDSAFGMTIAQGAIGSVVHHQEGGFALYAKFQHTDNMGMDQAHQVACFHTELVHVVAGQLAMQHFDGGLGAEVNMFSKVDFSEATFSQWADELIVAKLLAYAVCHIRTLSSLA